VNAEYQLSRAAVALTHRAIESLQTGLKAYRVPDLRCPGLAIRVASSGAKTWDLAFRIRGAGRMRRRSLGPFPAISLDDARERSGELTRAAKAGRDLLAEEEDQKRREDARLKVEALIETYARRMLRGRLRTANEIEQRLRRVLVDHLQRHADGIQRRELREIFDRVADRGAPREAEKQRQVTGAMYRRAVGNDIVTIDPTAGILSYGAGQRRERVLTDTEIGVFWKWLPQSGLRVEYVLALQLQMAIGARIGEIAGMRVEEFDRTTWLWTLPASRSKNKRGRVTPIIGTARELIVDRLRSVSTGPLFRTERGEVLSSSNVASILVKYRPTIPVHHFVSHDLRRTVATGMAELGVPYEVVAAVLGHEVGSASVRILTRHYIRTDFVERKRSALEAWDSKLRKIVTAEELTANEVVPSSSSSCSIPSVL
jgi:integrase